MCSVLLSEYWGGGGGKERQTEKETYRGQTDKHESEREVRDRQTERKRILAYMESLGPTFWM